MKEEFGTITWISTNSAHGVYRAGNEKPMILVREYEEVSIVVMTFNAKTTPETKQDKNIKIL